MKVGLIGYGKNGWMHLMLARFHPLLRKKINITTIYDPNPTIQAELYKTRLRIAPSWEDLLNYPDLDSLIISSPPQFHAQQVIQGLQAGKHVFSEVPMALTKADLEAIIQAEQASKKKYQYGENYIYFAEVLYASHLVENGAIGPTVYAEAEYLHDITYRWLENGQGVPSIPRRESWYSLFDPLQYAHSIGPAQVALGGLHHPEPFIEVMSYANDIGGKDNQPICSPAKAFQVALFRSATDKIAKCANAYIFAREPTRMGIQVVGERGTYEASQYGRPSRLFLADDHIITRFQHRKGRSTRVGRLEIQKVARQGIYPFITASVRVLDDWITAIQYDKPCALSARIGANMSMAGIAASESARTHQIVEIPLFT